MNDQPTPLGGTCSARFDPVRELFAAKLESGEDLGASVAVSCWTGTIRSKDELLCARLVVPVLS